MEQLSVDIDAMAKQFFGDIPVGIEPQEFVQKMDKRLDELILEGTRQNVNAIWDTLDRQLIACVAQGWGEIRSVDTFARQLLKMGTTNPDLKLRVSRQLHDEMRHYKMYRDCAAVMSGRDVVIESAPEKGLMGLFDYFDTKEDILEEMFVCQFCSEKGALILFSECMAKYELHPDFKAVLEKILPDERFHVSNGKVAALLLAEKGEETQAKMVWLAAESIAYTIAGIEGGSGTLAAF
jgi:hypothetical protein